MDLLTLSHVSKTYTLKDTPITVLKDITFSVRMSDFVAIMGPSGSGKSTLLHIMGGLDRPSSGRVEIDGNDISEMTDSQLAFMRNKVMGFVFQNFYLLNYYTALENVCVPLIYSGTYRAEKEFAMELLSRMGLSGRAHHKPNELSGGERQRVALARALVNKPKIIFADEPTGNLDSKNGEAIMNYLEDINREGTTLVVITHDPHVARRAKKVIRIEDGELI